VGWVDRHSGHAVGGVLVKLISGCSGMMPVTTDYWLLDGAGVLPRIHNCAKLQVDVVPVDRELLKP